MLASAGAVDIRHDGASGELDAESIGAAGEDHCARSTPYGITAGAGGEAGYGTIISIMERAELGWCRVQGWMDGWMVAGTVLSLSSAERWLRRRQR
jgi:hypothetical protein